MLGKSFSDEGKSRVSLEISKKNIRGNEALAEKNKIKVLWITHDFPPRRSSGIYRPVKIYKYIDKSAYDVEFLTQSIFNEDVFTDESLLSQLDPLPKIYRIPNVVVDNLIGSVLSKIRKLKATGEQSVLENRDDTKTSPRESRSLSKKAYRLWMMALYFPDQYFIWGWLATFKALILHAKNRYDIVYTTAHPQSGHLPGFILKSLGVKWVADYRDAGIISHYYLFSKDYEKGTLRTRIERLYQKSVLRRADQVISHSYFLKEAFSREFNISKDKITDISNGYDEHDFLRFADQLDVNSSKNEEIHILHMGIWYLSSEESDAVLKKLNTLASELAIMEKKLVVNALGFDICQHCVSSDFKFDYKFHPTVPHNQVVNHLMISDAYLMANTSTIDMTGFLPGKLWEYLRGKKPIIFFGTKGEAWKIVQECTTGIHVDYHSSDRINPFDIIENLSKSDYVDRSFKYSWAYRAKEFDSIFQKTISGNVETRQECNT
jgi:glycosyltransferase involved in cell wall biosynthesis